MEACLPCCDILEHHAPRDPYDSHPDDIQKVPEDLVIIRGLETRMVIVVLFWAVYVLNF